MRERQAWFAYDAATSRKVSPLNALKDTLHNRHRPAPWIYLVAAAGAASLTAVLVGNAFIAALGLVAAGSLIVIALSQAIAAHRHMANPGRSTSRIKD